MPLSFKLRSQMIVDRIRYKCNKIFKNLKKPIEKLKWEYKYKGK